ncbi:protoporphyrinogen oxidase [Lactococcus termiticola]|uniref:Coproporphyrinogen III oxidase n=1 Tax=Lactococcus termiticola TaxID=2169526 RepID=A0A2R5HE26_9LACT|nr:protoporphyrinogen oxidase [Lactococcus termiticola]GBG96289.1 Protoporphyrinogen oxidase [Lactococcus termiticola]
MTKKIAIIGAGITGLSAAYYLQKEIQEKNLDLDWVLIESTDRLGGKIETVRRDGYIIERGPDSFLARKTAMVDLAREVGMDDKLVNNATGSAFIYLNGKLHPIPAGSIMGIPTNEETFQASELFTDAAKARAKEDLTIEKSPAGIDQSMGQFFRRRLGDEVVENLIEPLLSGVYGGDLDTMSLISTYPQFYEVEQKYGNLIDGMKKQAAENAKNTPYQGQKKGMFLNFNTGLESLVDAIEAALPAENIMKSTAVNSIAEGYELSLSNGEILHADSIILTTPHEVSVKLLGEHGIMKDEFEDVPSTSVVTISMAFPAEALKEDIDGTGFLVSRNADFSITACTWIHKKWAHSTPEGKIVLRAFLGKPGDERYTKLSDEEITRLALRDLGQIMELNGEPEFVEISRLDDSMPQYTVGHKERLAKVRQDLADKMPGVFIAGMSYDGIGLPDNVVAGREAEKLALRYLTE